MTAPAPEKLCVVAECGHYHHSITGAPIAHKCTPQAATPRAANPVALPVSAAPSPVVDPTTANAMPQDAEAPLPSQSRPPRAANPVSVPVAKGPEAPTAMVTLYDIAMVSLEGRHQAAPAVTAAPAAPATTEAQARVANPVAAARAANPCGCDVPEAPAPAPAPRRAPNLAPRNDADFSGRIELTKEERDKWLRASWISRHGAENVPSIDKIANTYEPEFGMTYGQRQSSILARAREINDKIDRLRAQKGMAPLARAANPVSDEPPPAPRSAPPVDLGAQASLADRRGRAANPVSDGPPPAPSDAPPVEFHSASSASKRGRAANPVVPPAAAKPAAAKPAAAKPAAAKPAAAKPAAAKPAAAKPAAAKPAASLPTEIRRVISLLNPAPTSALDRILKTKGNVPIDLLREGKTQLSKMAPATETEKKFVQALLADFTKLIKSPSCFGA